MRIQAFLTAAAVNLKRLAKALAAIFVMLLGVPRELATVSNARLASSMHDDLIFTAPTPIRLALFNSPTVRWILL